MKIIEPGPVQIARPRVTGQGAPGVLADQSGLQNLGSSIQNLGKLIGDVHKEIEDTKGEQETNRALAETLTEFEVLREQNLEPEAFEEQARKTVEERSKAITNPKFRDRFQSQAHVSVARMGVKVRAAKNQRDLAQAFEDGQIAIQGFANSAARTDDPIDREDYRQMQADVREQLRARGAGTPGQIAALEQLGKSTESAALTARLLRDDPVRGMEMVEAREGAFEFLDESARQQTISQFKRAKDLLESAAAARAKEGKALEKLQLAEMKEQAESELKELDSSNSLDVDTVYKYRDYMDPKTLDWWLKRAASKAPATLDQAYYDEVVEEYDAALNGQPDRFLTRSLDPNRLGNRYESLQKSKVSIRTGLEDEAKKDLQRQIKQRTPKGSMPYNMRQAFDIRAREEFDEFVKRNDGIPPDRAQLVSILDGVQLILTSSQGVGGWKNRELAEGFADVNGVPAPMVETISNLLEDLGERQTDETVADEFTKMSRALRESDPPRAVTIENLLWVADRARAIAKAKKSKR